MTISRSFDIVIVGCGIAGAGLAAMLGSGKKIAVLEREDRPGYHSTGRSAAIFIKNYGSPEIRSLTRSSFEFLSSPPREFNETGFLSPRGMMLVADKHGLDKLEKELNSGDGLVELNAKQAIDLAPLLNTDVIKRFSYEKDAQDIDVAALHQAFIRQAKKKGVTFIMNADFLSASQKEKEWLIETTDGQIKAQILVNAAGAWADQIALKSQVKEKGIMPMRRSMAVLPCPEGFDIKQFPLVADVMEKWYMKPDAGRLLVSPSDETPVEPHDAYVDDMILAEGLHNFEQATTCTVTHVENQWAGLRSFSPDRNPVVGFDQLSSGFFWLAGQGGYGIQTAPALSRFAADLIQGNEFDPALPSNLGTELRPNRFD